MCEATLFPRARIIGLDDESSLAAVVDSIVYDRGAEFESIVRCEGERGIEGEFASVPVRIGERGIIEIVEG
jgi:malate/lactate dehydrogenase